MRFRSLGLLGVAFLALLLVCRTQATAQFEKTPLEFEEWKSTTGFMGPRTSHAVALVGNRIYILGGLNASGTSFTLYDDVQTAVLGNDGDIPSGSWQKLRSFPAARSGLGAVARNNILYIVGGYAQSGALADVHFADINADGSLGAWKMSPSKLHTARSNHRLEVVQNPAGAFYLAAIAGVGEIDGDTVHFDDIEVAPITADGSVGQWKKCPYHLKGGRSAPATVVTRDVLYVMGGWGDLLLSDVFRDVQYASVRSDGCPDHWHTNPSGLNIPLYGHTAALLPSRDGDILVVLGGNGGNGNYFSNVQMAKLTGRQTTTRWYFSQRQFPVPRWGHSTVVYNGFLYVIGGAQRNAPGFLADVQLTRVNSPPEK